MDSPGYIKCTVCKVIAVQKSVEGGGKGGNAVLQQISP